MTLIQRVSRDGTAPDITRPDPAKVITGDPVHSTWNLEETDGLYAGLWQSTPGKWRVSYSEWEYFRILSGYSLLTGAVFFLVRFVTPLSIAAVLLHGLKVF